MLEVEDGWWCPFWEAARRAAKGLGSAVYCCATDAVRQPFPDRLPFSRDPAHISICEWGKAGAPVHLEHEPGRRVGTCLAGNRLYWALDEAANKAYCQAQRGGRGVH
jgi:hypothetical protein